MHRRRLHMHTTTICASHIIYHRTLTSLAAMTSDAPIIIDDAAKKKCRFMIVCICICCINEYEIATTSYFGECYCLASGSLFFPPPSSHGRVALALRLIQTRARARGKVCPCLSGVPKVSTWHSCPTPIKVGNFITHP